jgi:hypothetical protein
MGKLFIAAVVALSFVGSASAEEDTLQSANTIMPGCRAVLNHDPAEAFGRGMCIGIITGLATGTALSRTALKTAFFCAPEGPTIEQYTKVVVAYVDKHPEETHENFVLLALTALGEAWPCK